jgi:acetyl esterase/lipase
MTFTLDPQLATAMEPMLSALPPEPAPVGDWLARRQGVEAAMLQMATTLPPFHGVTRLERETTAADGVRLRLCWYAPADGAKTSAAVLYVHGGGMILGSVDIWDPWVAQYVEATGVPILAVDYRLAPEHPHPTPVEDCYAALGWLAEHADELGVDTRRIAVMGDSAGGGLAAGVALMARDRNGPSIARQLLIYPMLDDRTSHPDPAIVPFATWSYEDNVTGWGALLGEAAGEPVAPAYAAPARTTDLSGLPSAYIEVGELDIFRDESVEYARRLSAAGVSTELHVHPGSPHAFDALGPKADVSRRAYADRLRNLSAL